jgi:hypothetical protein
MFEPRLGPQRSGERLSGGRHVCAYLAPGPRQQVGAGRRACHRIGHNSAVHLEGRYQEIRRVLSIHVLALPIGVRSLSEAQH